MMVALPVVNPVTTPDDGSTVAVLPVVLQAPVPPSARAVVKPRHIVPVPVIGPGMGLISTCTVVVSEKVPSVILTLNESVPEYPVAGV